MKQNDFDQGVLEPVEHRPWPMPDGPWIMTQSWHDLLFAHWPLPQDALRDNVPDTYPIDTFGGHAWIGVIPFHMTNVAPRGIPALPWVSAFPELNVRTYVTVGGKPGVFFFSLDAGNPIAVRAARTLFSLPYYSAEMHVDAKDGWLH
ncbi:MAG: YqjF family protein, partial [Burkholderiales bacterium]